MAKHKILVVDDEESLCEILQFNLEVEGYEADVAYSTAAVFGTLPANVTVHKGDIIFPRIDVEKEIDELNQLILAAQPKEEPQEPEFTPQPLAEEIDIDTFGKTDLRLSLIHISEPTRP